MLDPRDIFDADLAEERLRQREGGDPERRTTTDLQPGHAQRDRGAAAVSRRPAIAPPPVEEVTGLLAEVRAAVDEVDALARAGRLSGTVRAVAAVYWECAEAWVEYRQDEAARGWDVRGLLRDAVRAVRLLRDRAVKSGGTGAG